METEVTLSEARRRVGRVTGADPAPWTPDDIRWIAAEWGRYRPELDRCRRLEGELVELERSLRPLWWRVAVDLTAGLAWWYRDAPPVARAALGAFGLFAMAFVWGWL